MEEKVGRETVSDLLWSPSYEPVMINFIGGPLDGINPINPLANCLLRVKGNDQGYYFFNGHAYLWILESDLKL
ncbi:MAG TPA: hypothetical protein VFO40_15575 [Chthoniobacterales bacterium]|nr:hypothetical protein [Chthoniobacterales bacterium]